MPSIEFADYEFHYLKPDNTIRVENYMGVENSQAVVDDLNWRRNESPECAILVSYRGNYQSMGPFCRKIMKRFEVAKAGRENEEKLQAKVAASSSDDEPED